MNQIFIDRCLKTLPFSFLDIQKDEILRIENIHAIPTEETLISKDYQKDGVKEFSEKRRHEYLAGRILAHEVLRQLGYKDIRISRSENGAPLWPNPVKASLSHDGEYIGIFASQNTRFDGLGLDIHYELPSKKCRSILRFVEFNSEGMPESWAKWINVSELTMVNYLICAKEAAYKSLPEKHQPTSLRSLKICDLHKTYDTDTWVFEISHSSFLKIRAHVVRHNQYYFSLARLLKTDFTEGQFKP